MKKNPSGCGGKRVLVVECGFGHKKKTGPSDELVLLSSYLLGHQIPII